MLTRDALNNHASRLRRPRGTAARMRSLALLAALALAIVFAAQVVAAPRVSAAPLRPAHALPVRSDPAENAILSGPPSQVKMWFSEALNPLDSRIVVVDPSNHEVDNRDSRVNPADQTEMVVGLQLLRPGTYVVVWRTQSAIDGHVTGGSYIFRIANADGSVPPVPATLPSGNVPGAAGFGSSSQTIDAPTLLQAFSDWLALLFALFWVGGLIWEVWALPVRRAPDGPYGVVALGGRLAARRFLRLAPYALGGALLADVGVALALTVEVAGSWRGALLPQFWQATIFSGSFGVYWWMRQGTLAAALALTLLAARRAGPAETLTTPDADQPALTSDMQDAAEQIPSWTHAALDVLRQTPRLPRRLAQGLLDLTPWRQAEVALAALLLFAFAMSGHAAATPPSERTYAVSVDLAHLIFSAVWLGGLFYISVVWVPAARALPERAQALLLARGAPEFGVIAIISAAALALTGSLNAGVRLTSLTQIITTAYGRTLFVKVELFLIMVAISAFHAFWLRPRLTRSLARASHARAGAPRQAASVVAQRSQQDVAERLLSDPLTDLDAMSALDVTKPRLPAVSPERAAQNGHGAHHGAADAASDETPRLRRQMEDWLRREALLGVGVLLCVALLALFAGTLAPAQAAVPAATSASAFSQKQSVGGNAVTLQISPAKFGANTFSVIVADAQGKPMQGASVLLLASDLDMDMGQQSLQLQPVAAQPGVYRAQGDLSMAGNWGITVKVLPPGAKDFISASYKLIVGT